MQGGCSIRGSNSSAARLSWHCGDAFTAVAPKKRAGKLSFCFFDVEFPLMAYALSFSTPRARLASADGFGIKKRSIYSYDQYFFGLSLTDGKILWYSSENHINVE